MSESMGVAKVAELFPDLFAGVRLMEGRLTPDDLARHVVRAAMAQKGVSGARLWRVVRGKAEVWAGDGILPAIGARTGEENSAMVGQSDDPTLWTCALGSDDFQVRAL